MVGLAKARPNYCFYFCGLVDFQKLKYTVATTFDLYFLFNLDNRNIQEDKERNFHIICARSEAIDHLLLSHDSVRSVHNTIYP